MRRTLCRAAALAGLILGPAALAQQPQNFLPQPRVNSAFPPGARAGSAVVVTVAGTDVDDPTGLAFSHTGITATLIPEEKPDPKKKPAPNRGNQQQNRMGIPGSAKFTVTVPADVPPGQYDVRVVNKWGVSNPRAFVVGDRPEVDELEPNNDVGDAPHREPGGSLGGGPMTVPTANTPRAQRVEFGTTVNGVLASATDVDYTVFVGKAGQRVLVSCLASSIDSRARPLVEVYDPAGRRLGLNRNYKDNDALLDVTLPADGDYFVRVSEFAYQQGGPEYFYRLTVGAGPWVDAVFPPVVTPGKPTTVTVYGRGLPGGKTVPGMQVDGRPVESVAATVTPPADRTRLAFRGRVAPAMGLQDGFEFRLPGPTTASNPLPIFLTDAKVVAEKDQGNDRPETAEPITTPCEVAGRIDKRYDRDFYSFTAKKGDVLSVDLTAEQIGSVSDLYLRVRDGKNKDISPELDDDPDVVHPTAFYTRSGDPPAYRFTAPADGTYLVLVGSLDANVSFGPRAFYRLRVAPPAPDFRPVVMARSKDQPSAVTARPDGEVAFDVYLGRSDGFTGPVTITAENLPDGVTAKPSLVGTNMKWGTLVLSAAAGAKEFTGPIRVKCSAEVNGKKVTREARPASITWGVPQQQNVPTVARLDHQLVLAVRPDRASLRIAADLAKATVKTKDAAGKDKEEKVADKVYLKPGDKLTLPVKVTWNEKEARPNPVTVGIEPATARNQDNPFQGNNPNQPVATLAKDKADGTVTLDVRSNAPPGTFAVVLRADTQVSFVRNAEQKDQKTTVSVLAFAPPVEVTVLPTTLAKLSVQPPAQLKLGTTTELTVKVERQFDYAGPFQVTVELPKDARGVTVKPVTLPAGKDEVTVPVEVDEDAKPAPLSNVVVRAVATLHGKFPIAHETKVNLAVVK